MSAIDDVVLKLTTSMPGGMEWKPDLHPRDHTGKFKKKFGGVFNALSGLKAGKYGSNTVYKGQAGYHAGLDNSLPDVPAGHKVGGVEVHAPTEHGYAPSVHHIDWHLAPGEKVYSVSGGPTFAPEKGATGAILHHADGSATVLMPTPEGEMPKIGATQSHFSDLAKNLTDIGYTIDTEHPLDSNDDLEAQKVQQEMAAVDHAKEIGAAPESAYGKKPEDAPTEPPAPAAPKPTYQEGHTGPGGNKIVHMLQDDAGNHVGHVEQLDNGKYTSHNAKGDKVGNITKHLPTAVEKAKSGKLTTPSTYQHKKPLKKAAAEEAAKKAAEPKAEISPEKKVAEEAPKPEPKPEPKPDPIQVDVKDSEGNHIGHIHQAHVDAPVTAHDAKGTKLSEHDSLPAAKGAVKVHAAHQKAEADAKVQAELKAKADAEAEKVKAKAAAEAPKEPAHLEGKTVFQHVHDEAGNHLGHIEKLDNGKFTSHDAAGNKVGNITKHLPTAIEKVKSGKLTTPEKKAKDDVTPVEAEVKDVSATEKHLTGENGQYIGKLVKDETTGKWQSYDASGEKLGYTISNTQTAIDKIKVAAAKNPAIADAPKEEPTPEPKPKVEEPYKLPIASVDGEIGHLEEGDTKSFKAVYKDGTVVGEYDHAKIAKLALQQHHIDAVQKTKLDDLKKDNEQVAAKVEKVEVDTPVGKVPLLPGEAAYTHKTVDSHQSPWAAIVQDGKVTSIYNPTTGETKDHNAETSWGGTFISGWQESLDKGKLTKAGEESPEKTPVLPEAEKDVHQSSVPDDESGFTHANFGEHGQNTVTLQPGEKLWTPVKNPSWGAWVEKSNGKADGYSDAGDKVVSDSTLPSGLENSGWKVTGSGPAIHGSAPTTGAPSAEIWKHDMTGVEYHFDANGIATKIMADGTKIENNAVMSASLHKALVENQKGGWVKHELPIPETHEPPAGATPEPVKKVAAKKAAAKKKLTDADLPKEFEFGGKVHKMKPGDSIWTKEVDGDTKVYSISGITGKGTIYNGDTTINYWLGDSNKKVSLASLKKNGWEKVAAGEAKQEISGPDAAVNLDDIPDDYHGKKSAYIYADNVFSSLTGWGSKLYGNGNNPADPEWGKEVAQYVANLTYIKANPDEFNLDKSDKMKVTKALTHANNAWKVHAIATKVDDPNYEPTAQDKTTLEEMKAYSDKVNTHYLSSALVNVAKKVKAAEFQASVKNLNFDLNHGSHEEFVNFAKNEGASFLGGMDESMVKDWVHAHLGTPDHYYESGFNTKSSIENKASQMLKMKAVAAHATAAAEKQAAMKAVVSKDEKLADKAVHKQYETLYKKVSKLHSEYETDSHNITYQGSNFYGYGPGLGGEDGVTTSAYFTPEELVTFLADHPEWKPSAEAYPLGNYAQLTAHTLTGSEGWSAHHLIDAPVWGLNDLGAMGAEHMTQAQRGDWLTSHLTADSIAKYQIEKDALETAGLDPTKLWNHPGNPNSPTGKLAVQALANHLNTLPYWTDKSDPYDLSSWSTEDLKKFSQDFGLNDAYAAKDIADQSNKYKLQHWLVWHDQLPEPQNTPSVSNEGKLTTKDGIEFAVPHGAYVSFDGTSHTVFTDDDGYYVVKKNGTETQHWKYNPDDPQADSKVSAHAYTLATANEKDATPNWSPVSLDWLMSGLSNEPKMTPKPDGVSQTTWDFVNGAEVAGKDLADFIGSDLAKKDDAEIAQLIHSNNYFNKENKLKLLAGPPAIQKLAAWTSGKQYSDESTLAGEVANAITAKAAAGDYLTPETETWTHPDSGKSLLIPPGASVHNMKDEIGHGYYAVVVTDNVGYKVTPQGTVMAYSYPATAKSQPEVFTSKANLSYEKAASEGESFTEHAFKKIDDAEAQATWQSHENETVAAFKFDQAVKKIDGGEKYTAMTKYLHTFPVGVKQLAMEAAQQKDTDTLDALAWRFRKGSYAIAPEVHTTPVVDPSAPYAKYIAEGQIGDYNTIYNAWEPEHIDQFIKDHNVSVESYADYYDKAQAVSQHLPSLIPLTVTTEDKIAKGMVDYQNLDLAATDKSYGGMHTKHGWTDQYGQEWMSKGFNSDPFGPFRVDVEHEANLIGKIFGFRSATSFTKEVGGKYSIIQKIADNIGDLKGFQPKDLNDKQLIGAMQEHVLDWLIANHDSHEENLLRLPDGETMLGIDKGQAFKHLGKDKLAVGYLPPENGAPVWYDRFYNDLTSGNVTKERADKIVQAVLSKAYAVQSRNDALYREHLETAFAQRPEGSWPSHLNTKETFIDYAMERKANLLKDFGDFYQGLYKKAGYDWTIDTEAFGKKVGGAHVANNAIYASEVKESSVFGKALMFNTPDLEDSHLIHNTMEQMNGGTTLLGAGLVRKDADKALEAWLKQRVEGKLAHGQKAYVPEVAKPGAALEHIPELHNAIVDYSKTVGKHATNGGKEPDGEYNSSYVSNATTQAATVAHHLAQLKEFRAKNPDQLYSGLNFSTLEQQDAWAAAAEQKLSEFKVVSEAHTANTPVKNIFPDAIPFEHVSYTPSKGLTLHDESKPVEKYVLDSGEHAVKTSDGGHYLLDKDGGKTWVSSQDYGNHVSQGKQVPLDEAKAPQWVSKDGTVAFTKDQDGKWKVAGSEAGYDDAQLNSLISASAPGDWTYHGPDEQAEKSQTVQIAGKVFKVTHRKAALHGGVLDPVKGTLIQKSLQNQSLQTGHEYTIEHGKVKIHYRPWNEPDVAKSQQGKLTYEVKDWDGGHEAIDDVLDTLRIAGLNLTEADAESLEHHYWNHLTGVIQDRSDANQFKVVTDHVHKAKMANPNMTTGESLAVLKEAWANKIGQDKVNAASWEPKFLDQYGHDGGHPYWLRPDFGLEDLKAQYGYRLPMHQVYDSEGRSHERIERAHKILLTGRLIATEERPRLGIAGEGMSSSGDQATGGAAFVFTRQNMMPHAVEGNPYFVMDPLAALRTSSFSYPYDKWGNTDERKSAAHFNPKDMYGHSDSGNELMLKHEAPIFAALYASEKERQTEISRLKSEGITEIHGRSLEDVVLTQDEWNNSYQKRVDKLWKELLEEAKKFTEGGA